MIDKLIFTSNYQREIITKFFPSLNNKSITIYSLIPHMQYTKIKGDDFGFLGGNNYFKGFHVLLSAAKKAKLKAACIKIAGTHRGPYIPNVIYVGRLKHLSKQFYDFYKSIKAVIVPTLMPEPRPYVVTEALQMGRLLIASKRGGIQELVQGAKGVMLIDPNPRELLTALNSFSLIDRETATDLGLHNREYILKKFDNSKIVQQFIKVLDDLLN